MNLTVEILEARDAPAVGVRLLGDVLLIRGTPGADVVTIRQLDSGGVRVECGRRWWQWDEAEVQALDFEGRGGNDRLIVLASPPEPPPLVEPEQSRR